MQTYHLRFSCWKHQRTVLLIKVGQLLLDDEQSIGTDGFPDLLDHQPVR